ncbi:AHH domain-containing protein [Archangium violaceum]|uniref:AHH domain-containing protein n=1 Tax=Archangium violaceum TaxID=83451 RepID=UPI0037BED96B
MSDNKGHYGSAELDELHTSVNSSTENGACLTGHLSDFKNFRNRQSCNYRYQAYEQAKNEPRIKERLHSYKTVTISNPLNTSAREAESGKMAPAYYCATLPIPQDGDWDIDGPKRDILRKTFEDKTVKIRRGRNFTQDTWPYWHNAHHLIPKGTLKDEILKEPSPVNELIQVALLKAKYNVNHKLNMLFIPQDQEVAELLNLPRHIQRKDGDAPDVPANYGNHPLYNKMVREIKKGLDTIITDYRSICEKAITAVEEEHDIPNPSLDKKKLEELSETLLQMLLGWGAGAAGKSNRSQGRSLDARAKEHLEQNAKRARRD